MGPAGGSDAAAGQVAGSGVGGVVSRAGLFERLGAGGGGAVGFRTAGRGEPGLLRSWIGTAGRGGSAAWVSVGHDERDPQRFWLSVLGALRQTAPGSMLV